MLLLKCTLQWTKYTVERGWLKVKGMGSKRHIYISLNIFQKYQFSLCWGNLDLAFPEFFRHLNKTYTLIIERLELIKIKIGLFLRFMQQHVMDYWAFDIFNLLWSYTWNLPICTLQLMANKDGESYCDDGGVKEQGFSTWCWSRKVAQWWWTFGCLYMYESKRSSINCRIEPYIIKCFRR